MTDRDLLEAAAMAAGYTEFCVASYLSKGYRVREGVGYGWIPWNPLRNDGDSFRLAVKLNLGISIPVHRSIRAEVVSFLDPSVSIREGGDDPAAATRRAIVRAAAEVGMKR